MRAVLSFKIGFGRFGPGFFCAFLTAAVISGHPGLTACAACVLHQYGGICPITRCAKQMLNGPCSGSREDRCEVDPARPCAWQLIYQRLKEIGQLDELKKPKPPKNWRPSQAGGCRTIIREDHRV